MSVLNIFLLTKTWIRPHVVVCHYGQSTFHSSGEIVVFWMTCLHCERFYLFLQVLISCFLNASTYCANVMESSNSVFTGFSNFLLFLVRNFMRQSCFNQSYLTTLDCKSPLFIRFTCYWTMS